MCLAGTGCLVSGWLPMSCGSALRNTHMALLRLPVALAYQHQPTSPHPETPTSHVAEDSDSPPLREDIVAPLPLPSPPHPHLHLPDTPHPCRVQVLLTPHCTPHQHPHHTHTLLLPSPTPRCVLCCAVLGGGEVALPPCCGLQPTRHLLRRANRPAAVPGGQGRVGLGRVGCGALNARGPLRTPEGALAAPRGCSDSRGPSRTPEVSGVGAWELGR